MHSEGELFVCLEDYKKLDRGNKNDNFRNVVDFRARSKPHFSNELEIVFFFSILLRKLVKTNLV